MFLRFANRSEAHALVTLGDGLMDYRIEIREGLLKSL